jgi:hypothetical protein
MRSASVVLLVGTILFVALACGGGKKGDSCGEEGRQSNCDKSLSCAKAKRDGSGGLVCLPTCVGQEDCEATEDCNGSTLGIPKVCQPK